MLRLVTTAVVLVAVLGVAAEVAAPPVVEASVEETVRDRTDGAATVAADAGEFPFVPGLLLDGRMDRLTVTLEEVGGHEVTLGTVMFSLEGIHLERAAMLRGDVRVTAIDAGEVLVEVEQRRLAEALGAPVDLDPSMVELAGRALRVAVGGAGPLEVPVPRELLPCTPEIEVAGELLRLHCELDEIPDVLVRAAQG